ncbi:UNVERIFIED_ORG: UDP-glucuronate 4-epimerase [Sphingomonas sp. R1F5B]
MATLVTGNAGFIGFHTAKTLLERGDAVVGLDVVNDYYDPAIKEARLKILAETAARTGAPYRFFRANLADRAAVEEAFAQGGVRRVVNLAAQAGVRYSIENPHAYVESNIVGFTNILEACRHGGIEHLVYASTSSVYGANKAMPFSEHVGVDHPLQFYAATKKANELMAHSYSHLYRLPTTGLRFFTVYGPWGRPDMALFLFARAILDGTPINVFNHGNHTRDFTYVDDIVAGVIRALDRPAQPDPAWDAMKPDPATSNAPYRIYNIGNNAPVKLTAYIEALENALGRKAQRNLLPLQPGDVPDTYADVTDLERDLGYKPATSVEAGVGAFVDWFRAYVAPSR